MHRRGAMAHAGRTAIITGASSGIGLELARIAAKEGFDLFIAADEPLEQAAEILRGSVASVTTFEGDLADVMEIDRFCDLIAKSGRKVDVLMANAGHGLGHGFLD